MKTPTLLVTVWVAALTAGCGQKGPLYLPDKNASVVTSPAGPDNTAPAQPAPATPKQPPDQKDDDSQSASPKPRT